MKEKLEKLQAIFAEMQGGLIAFSGGVDSTLLLKLAADALGDRVEAVLVCSELLPEKEKQAALHLAESLQVELHLLDLALLAEPCFLENPIDRCYHCKKRIFTEIQQLAKKIGKCWVMDGSNVDDQTDYRPGRQALQELGIRSPLEEAGFGKREIRLLSEVKGLPTWDKPAMACLASRIPYGKPISRKKLLQIEKGEAMLQDLGLSQLRLRHHESVARLEVLPEEWQLLFVKKDEIVCALKQLGFLHVVLDLEGYQSGSLNRGVTGDAK